MRKKNMSHIIIFFSVTITLILSLHITANADYDEYGNYYDPYEGSSEAYSDLYSSEDNTELTSEDWSELQESLNSTFHINSHSSSDEGDDFKDIKDNNDNTNDSWHYLLWGLILIGLGIAIIIVTIATNLHVKSSIRSGNNINAGAKKTSKKPKK